MDQLSQNFVFILGPGTLGHKAGVFKLKPSMEALNLRLVFHEPAYLVPFLVSELLNTLEKSGILR